MTSAIILAAGGGSRLMPLTADRPKCLVEVAGRPLIGWQLSTIRAAGIDDITIVGGYRSDQLAALGCSLVHNPDWAKTNMVESLFCAEDRFGDDLLVGYGDIAYRPEVLVTLLDSEGDAAVVVDRAWQTYWARRFDDPLSDAESLKVGADGAILDIGNPVETISEIEAQYIGLMRFRGSELAAFRQVKETLGEQHRPWLAKRPVRQAYMTDLLMEMVLRGHHLSAVQIDGGWVEVDSSDDLRIAEEIISEWPHSHAYAG